MYEIGIPFTLTTGAGTLTFNGGTGASAGMSLPVGDEFRIIDYTEPRTIRTSPRDVPQGNGAIVGTKYRGARYPTVDVALRVRSSLDEAGMRAARNAMAAALEAALDSILNTAGTWAYTPTGLSARSYAVTYDAPLVPSGSQGVLKVFTFGLIAPA